jgi:hypothetical protein
MATSDGYGQRLGERLRVEKAPAIVTKTLRKAEIAVTEIRCDDPLPGMTTPVQREDAYLVGLILRDFPHRIYWEEGRQTPVCDLRAGDTCIHDLKRDPVSFLEKPRTVFLFVACSVERDRRRRQRPANWRPGVQASCGRQRRHDRRARWYGTAGVEPSPASQPVVCRPRLPGDRDPCRFDLWRHAADVAAGSGRACAVAGAPRQGNSLCQSRW